MKTHPFKIPTEKDTCLELDIGLEKWTEQSN